MLILLCTRKLIIKLQGAASRGELLREFILDAFHWTCPKIDSLAAVSSGPNRVLLGAPAIYPVSFMAGFNELPRIARFSQAPSLLHFQSKIPRGKLRRLRRRCEQREENSKNKRRGGGGERVSLPAR